MYELGGPCIQTRHLLKLDRQDPHLRYVYKKYSKAIIYSLLSVSLGLPSPDTLVRSAKLDEYLVTYRTKWNIQFMT